MGICISVERAFINSLVDLSRSQSPTNFPNGFAISVAFTITESPLRKVTPLPL